MQCLCLIYYQPLTNRFTWPYLKKIHIMFTQLNAICLLARNFKFFFSCSHFSTSKWSQKPQQSSNNTAGLGLIIVLDVRIALRADNNFVIGVLVLCVFLNIFFGGLNDLTLWILFLDSRMVGSLSEYNDVLQENDPPPWLHRMRELGYPPGYLGKLRTKVYIWIFLCKVCKHLFLICIVYSVSSSNHILD